MTTEVLTVPTLVLPKPMSAGETKVFVAYLCAAATDPVEEIGGDDESTSRDNLGVDAFTKVAQEQETDDMDVTGPPVPAIGHLTPPDGKPCVVAPQALEPKTEATERAKEETRNTGLLDHTRVWQPTMELRWFGKHPMLKHNKLQQAWVHITTGALEWRNVPFALDAEDKSEG